MLEEYGNFWNVKVDARCITTNGILRKNGNAIMGAGIALQARDRCKGLNYDLEEILGKMIREHGNHVFYLGNNLFSFPTKHNWKDKSDVNLIKRSCYEIMFLANNFPNYHRILMTEPGCGNGGLLWKDVGCVIRGILDDRFVIIHHNGDVANDMLCTCGGMYVHYMDIEAPEGRVNQKGTTKVYECNKCHTAFER